MSAPRPRRAMRVESARGSAAEFHARSLPDPVVPSLWVHEVERPALVLGSRQTHDVVDTDACARAGVEVVRRRSGGGVVLVEPGAMLWIDVVVPADDDRWTDDVHLAMEHVGDAWRSALAELVVGELEVHRGAMVRGAWSDLVCFAGVGPGEVLLDGIKLVGISQRRTRVGARFQCAVHRHFDAAATTRLLAPPSPTPGELPPVAVLAPGLDGDDVVTRLRAALDAR